MGAPNRKRCHAVLPIADSATLKKHLPLTGSVVTYKRLVEFTNRGPKQSCSRLDADRVFWPDMRWRYSNLYKLKRQHGFWQVELSSYLAGQWGSHGKDKEKVGFGTLESFVPLPSHVVTHYGNTISLCRNENELIIIIRFRHYFRLSKSKHNIRSLHLFYPLPLTTHILFLQHPLPPFLTKPLFSSEALITSYST